MISLGLDSGSSMTKAVLLEDMKIIDTKMIPTSISPRKSLEALYREIKKQHKEIDVIVTTGYGRNLLDQADFKITEITCHAAGAFFMNPDCDTIIDIGGQDSKVITIDDLGCVESICQRTAAFAQKLAPANPKVFFSGGLAQFDVIKQSLANHLGVKEVATDSLCQYTGAIGAAVFGIRKIKQ